jgi:uncharacterized membrane protein
MMYKAILWGTHAFASIAILAIPNLTRREILFGVRVGPSFRETAAGVRAIRVFRLVVAATAASGMIAILLLNGLQAVAAGALALLCTAAAGVVTFMHQHKKLLPFGVGPSLIRDADVVERPDRLPWYTWLGAGPFVLLALAAEYLRANWSRIPAVFPVHWGLNGQPDRWVERTTRGVYGPLILGAALDLWIVLIGLAIWFGSRRNEPLRRPVLVTLVALEWMLALLFGGLATKPLIDVPLLLIALGPFAILVPALVYLTCKSNAPRETPDPTPNECWKGGLIYYNRNDPALFVERRGGVGFTANAANPWSWVIMGCLLIVVLTGVVLLG